MLIADVLGSMSRRGAIAALGLFAAALSFERAAGATPEYPLVLDSTYGTECPQLSRCLVCHTTARGGQSTAVQPFAITLRRYGFNRGRDSGALQSALAQLPDDVDSDGDGMPDEAELMMCGNPSGDDLGGGPQYGCDGAQLVPWREPDAPLALVALLAMSWLVRRRGASAGSRRAT